jgi:hypothetical protein
VNAQTDRGIRVLRPDLQFDRYLMTVCSLVLMVALVVGAAGYASIHALLSSTTTAAKAARDGAATQLTLRERP